MIPNIVVTGYAGAGKSTVADMLIDDFDLQFERISFAEPLKVMLNTVSDRQRLQEFGTDIVRRYEPHAWVRLFEWQLAMKTQLRHLETFRTAVVKAQPHVARHQRWVVDDCRFPNELITLKDKGWAHVHVDAPRSLRAARLRAIGKLQDESQLEHLSETALDDMAPDYIISNNSNDRDDLFNQVRNVMEQLNARW
jgi:dephospho-CoA kinase